MPKLFGLQSVGCHLIDHDYDVAVWAMLQAFKIACICYAYTAIACRTLTVHTLLLRLLQQSFFPYCHDVFPW